MVATLKKIIGQNAALAFKIDHAYGLYALLPLLEEIIKTPGRITLIIPSALAVPTQKYLAERDKFKVLFVDNYIQRRGKYFTKLFEVCFVSHDFSPGYTLRKRQKWSSALFALSRLMKPFRISRRNVNSLYRRLASALCWIGFFNRLPLDTTDFVISLTKEPHPYLLAPFAHKHILIMESWDHPMKEPFLLAPDRTLTWNDALATELNLYQAIDRTVVVPQVHKFRYIRECRQAKISISAIENTELAADLERLVDKKYIIYPLCTSSTYLGFEGEVNFLRELARCVAASGLLLYLRPYPLAPASDGAVLADIPGTVVGTLSDDTNGMDVLNVDAQRHKYLLLQRATGVINVGTTFALDAAMVGTPVLQLKLPQKAFGNFGRYSRGAHIQRHLWGDSTVKFAEGEQLKIGELLLTHAVATSHRLNSWINNEG